MKFRDLHEDHFMILIKYLRKGPQTSLSRSSRQVSVAGHTGHCFTNTVLPISQTLVKANFRPNYKA